MVKLATYFTGAKAIEYLETTCRKTMVIKEGYNMYSLN